MQPREYQQAAIDAVFAYFNAKQGNPLIVMPTATGKSICIAGLIKQACKTYPLTRFLVLHHVKELISQNVEKLKLMWPAAPVGICSAGLNKKDTGHQILFAGIGSVARKVQSIGYVDLILVDEAHTIPPDGNAVYLKVIRALKLINPNLKVIGLTATDFRMGQGRLTDGGEIFTDVAIDMTTPEWFAWFIANGYLVQPIPQKTRAEIDTSGVSVVKGEFNATELQEASDRYEVTLAACKEAVAYGQMRRSWITFCSGIEHALHAAEILNGLGIQSAAVHSKMKDKERDEIVAAWKAGELRNVTNNGILTTGVDNPKCDLILMLRATMSPGLWVQMIGRGMRTAPGKKDCLILDFASNTKRLGTIDAPQIPKRKGEGNGEIPIKLCEHCGAYNHISARFCVQCFEPFDIAVKINEKFDASELLSSATPDVRYFDVGPVVYKKNVNRQTHNETVKVMYHCGGEIFSEFLSFNDANGYAGRKAREWWKMRFGDNFDPPSNVDLALGSIAHAPQPKRIRVWTNKGKYPEILSHEF